MRKSRAAAALAAVTGSVGIGLFGAAPAMATAPSPLTVNQVTLNPDTAGSSSSYAVGFTVASGTDMPKGTTGGFLELVAGPGTYFSACNTCSGIYTVEDQTTSTSIPVSAATVSSSSAGSDANRVQIDLDLSSAGIAGGDSIQVSGAQVTNPVNAQTYTMTVTTSADSTGGSADYTVKPSAPSSITDNSGDNNTEPVGGTYPTLSVEVTDGHNPIAGVSVTFTAPTSGASGTFDTSKCPGNTASTPSTQCVTTTDSTGVATASTFTANQTVGSFLVTANAGEGATGPLTSQFHLQNLAAKPTSVTPGAAGASPDTEGVGNVTYTVHFTTNQTLPSGDTITVTAPNGTTFPSPACTLGGLQSCTNPKVTYGSSSTAAYVGTAIVAAAEFPGSGSTSGTKNQITITLGGGTTTSSIPANTPVTVTVTGATNPKVASPDYEIAVFDQVDPGVAMTTPAYQIVPSAPYQIVIHSGDSQTTPVATAFPQPLDVIVQDADGNPEPAGTPVTFVLANTNGQPGGTFPGGITQQTDQTNLDGQVSSSTITANQTTGPWSPVAELFGGKAPVPFSLTNAPGTPTQLVSPSGGGQSSVVAHQFGNPLAVTVEDSYGNVVPNAPVTFSAPAGEPTASFASCSANPAGTPVNECIVDADANGVATSSAFTAGHGAGIYQISASSGTGSQSFTETNTHDSPAQVAMFSGTSQSAPVGTPFAAPLVAQVTDQYGNAIAGQQVTFTAPGTPASGTFAADTSVCTGDTGTTPAGECVTTTGSNGKATSSAYTANSTSGADTVTATDTTDSTTSQLPAASFELTNLAGNASQLADQTGSSQTAQVGSQYAQPLQAVVEDQDNNPVSGTDVTFSIVSGDATFTNGKTTCTETSGPDGTVSSLGVVAGHTAGAVTVDAAIGASTSSQATYSLQNTPGPASAITVSNGSGQSAAVGTPFAAPLVAQVTDQYGNPEPNVSVTFTTPASGPSATFAGGQSTAAVSTDSTGKATSPPFTANSTVGTWSAQAQLTLAASVETTAAETNVPGSGVSFAAASGSGQSAHVGQAFLHGLTAVVRDAHGDPIAGQSVTFTLPASEPTATFADGAQTATVATDSHGLATSPAPVAGLQPGSYVASATTVVGGQAEHIQFGLTNTDGYWLAGSDGSVQNFGDAVWYGSTGTAKLDKPVVGMASFPGGGGYWLVASDGGIFSFGRAGFHGSTGGIRLNQPIVGMASTPDGGGYWLVASDGGIFAFGDARFHGSTGGVKLNQPIVGMAATPDGGGYWLVASDGGMFAFGDAHFYGSTGGIRLNKPVVGMAAAPSGNGYWLVASDGGIFAFGPGAHFYGSTGNVTLAQPIVGMTAAPDGRGYWFVAHDGGIFAFGPDAKYEGSGSGAGRPVIGMAEG